MIQKTVTQNQREQRNKLIDKLAEMAKIDWMDPKNHLAGRFSTNHDIMGWSIESFFYCIDYSIKKECCNLLCDYCRKEKINEKFISNKSWEGSSYKLYGFNTRYNTLTKFKEVLKNHYDIIYNSNLRYNLRYFKLQKDPMVLYKEGLSNYRYFTNIEKYHSPDNIKSDACIELLNFIDNNAVYIDKSENVTLKVGYWNNRFTIIKLELPENKYIVCYSYGFAKMNNSNDKTNQYYYGTTKY